MGAGQNATPAAFVKSAPVIVEGLAHVLSLPEHSVRGIIALALGKYEDLSICSQVNALVEDFGLQCEGCSGLVPTLLRSRSSLLARGALQRPPLSQA
eukprot:2188626-Amphidinium_carterae.1